MLFLTTMSSNFDLKKLAYLTLYSGYFETQ